MRNTPPTTSRRDIVAVALVALLLHVAAIPLFGDLLSRWELDTWERPQSVRMLDGDPLDAMTPSQVARLQALERALEEKKPEEEPEEEPEPELPDGQVVETVAPTEEKVPLQSDYLAEHDNAVPEETRTEAFKVNPEVLSNMYSRDSKMAFEDLMDVGAKDVSTGATVGSPSDSTAPGKGAPRSIIPSEYALTNKEGLAAPTRASSSTQSLSGAPQNDLLNEKLGQSVALNTREFIGSAYMNRIRRAVNFYWNQNLENLSSSTRAHMSSPSYRTEIAVVLSADGVLESITITDECGLSPLDNAVVEAFRVAGPFPNPPEQLVKKDGRVYLSDMDFTVQLSHAQMQYQGIDPRAGVQFPGILKSPR